MTATLQSPSGTRRSRRARRDRDRRRWAAFGAAVLVGAAVVGTAIFSTSDPAAAGFGDPVALVSVNTAAVPGGGNKGSSNPQVSADGKVVVFESTASDLVPGDTNGIGDVFVRDLGAGTMYLVSADSDGGSANGVSSMARVSGDGKFVVFESVASDLVDGVTVQDTNGGRDVFVRDLVAGTTALVSVNGAGDHSGNKSSSNPQVSGDGTMVVFESAASDLVAGDTKGIGDVFVRDLGTGTTSLVSADSDGGSANGVSSKARVSGDGKFVVFESAASDLVDGVTVQDTNGGRDVFVRDLVAGTTALVSVNDAGDDSGDKPSSNPQVSGDGKVVVFESTASDLVAGDTNGIRDVFVRDVGNSTSFLVSAHSDGGSANGPSSHPQVGGEASFGRFVVFESTATDLVDGVTVEDANGGGDVFVRDLAAGTTSLVSVNDAGDHSGNKSSSNPRVSGNGKVVVFESTASDLVDGDTADDTNGTRDVFARHLGDGVTYLASVNDAGGDSAGGASSGGQVSGSGNTVVFTSSAPDLVPLDLVPGVTQVYASIEHAPVAADDAYSVDEDATLTTDAAAGVLHNDTDADGDPLAAELVGAPPVGLTLNDDGSFTYNSASDFNGSFSFQYTATDGDFSSDPATVTIDVVAVNDAPVALDDAYTVGEDGSLYLGGFGIPPLFGVAIQFLGNDSDVDGDTFALETVNQPSHGTLTVDIPGIGVSYAPDAGFNGEDAFTYTVSDGTATSNLATVSITVSPVDDLPVAAGDAFVVDAPGEPKATALAVVAPGVLGNDTDEDSGDTLTAVWVAGPSHGSVTLNADGSFIYTPFPPSLVNPPGPVSDSFTYQAKDAGGGLSAVATISITIT